jgi:O-antigen/teichoic acid export membrane protein
MKPSVNDLQQKRRGILWNALGSTMFAANTLVMVVVVSRTSSIDTVGCFGIALAIAQLLLNIGLFGVDLFQMTDYKKHYAFSDYFRARILTCLLMALVCLCLVIWGIPEPEKKLLTVLLTMLYLTHAIGNLYQGLLFQENRLDLSGQALFFRVLLALLAFVIAQIITRNVSLSLVASIIASIIGIGIWGIHRTKPYHDRHTGLRLEKAASILRCCTPLFISSFLVLFIFNASRYGIDWLMDDTTQGYFSLIVLPALVINLISQFIFRPVLNDIARALERGDIKGFSRIFVRQLFIVAVLTVGATLAMPLIGLPLLTMLYATDLSAFPREASLLIVGGGLFALNQLFYSVLIIMRRQGSVLVAYVVSVAVAIPLTIGAIIGLGLLGACLAFVLSQIPILALFAGAVARGLKVTGSEARA